jgi:hypothetical protein
VQLNSKNGRHLFNLSLVILLLASTVPGVCDELKRFDRFEHSEIGKLSIYKNSGKFKTVAFASQMQVNTDGAPNSYHPDNKGITHICNGLSVGENCRWKPRCLGDFNQARSEGFRGTTKICFFAMVTDKLGIPLVQKKGDPNPGYYISTTALQQPGINPQTPQAQLDSNQVPFIVIPGPWQSEQYQNIQIGDFALVYRKSNKSWVPAIVGDLGPRKKLGEGSVYLHQQLGNNPFVMRPDGHLRAYRGIKAKDAVYFIFPGSRRTEVLITSDLIKTEGAKLLKKFGGEKKIKSCSRKLK